MTRSSMTRPIAIAALVGASASIPASPLKAISEPPLQRAAESLWPPTEAQKALVGADPSGRPENMPPAVIAERVARWLGRAPLDDRSKIRAQSVIHYAFGAVLGAGYGMAVEVFPALTAGLGVPAGAASMRSRTRALCRCSVSGNLLGVYHAVLWCGSSPVTCSSASPSNWADAPLRGP